MSLPQEPVFGELKKNWVVAWKNIIKEKYVGESNGYTAADSSIGTTNGAGPTNVQVLMLSPDGIVLHALPGFWHPEDLAREMAFAHELWALWKSDLTRDAKDAKFAEMQIAAWKTHPTATTMRSRWQGFDAANERDRLACGIERDTVQGAAIQQPLTVAQMAEREAKMRRMKAVKQAKKEAKAAGKSTKGPKVRMKPLNQLVHERMSVRPFLPLESFDVAEFANYGRTYYDNNKKVDGKGSTLMTPKRVAKAEAKQARMAEREARRAEKLARRAGR